MEIKVQTFKDKVTRATKRLHAGSELARSMLAYLENLEDDKTAPLEFKTKVTHACRDVIRLIEQHPF